MPNPIITSVRAVWRGAQAYDFGRRDGPTSSVDGEAKSAPGPVETLLGALATCSGVDVVDILAKRRTPVRTFEIDVVAERRPTAPKRVRRLEIEYRIEGDGIEPVHAERAIELAFDKYCSVAASLGADIEATSRLTLNGRRFDPVPRRMWQGENAY